MFDRGKRNCKNEKVACELGCDIIGCEYVYIGERGRDAFCRGREHLLG